VLVWQRCTCTWVGEFVFISDGGLQVGAVMGTRFEFNKYVPA
jgi:hypothetical protein